MKRIACFLLPIFLIPFALAAQIQHIEPLNWWVGMKNSALQIMVNGNGVGTTTPIIPYPGVRIQRFTKGDSDNYLFIDLLIAPTTQPGNLSIIFKKNDKEVFRTPYTLLPRKGNASNIGGFNASDVVYLIMPDRFANGEYANDVITGTKEMVVQRKNPGRRHGGDIRGIINHLDYIADMGFTAIWPTPLLENDMPAYSYHGYAITNHYKVDPRYGTLDDYKELASKARQKGIKLIFDEVLNHTGTGYWWTKDLPFKNWINFPEKFTLTNHRRTTNQDKYASTYDKALFTNGWFDVTMADMNASNPFLAKYLIQSSIWWIETLQLGGIRQDTYGYSNKQFLTNWSCSIMQEYPNFNMVGEEWSVNPLIGAYWQQGKINYDGYRSCLKTVMDFPLQDALVQALKVPEGKIWGKGFTQLYEALANDYIYAEPNNLLIFGDNHDMDRLFTQLEGDVAATQMALTYLLTIRGIPQLFYGTEILMQNNNYPGNHGIIRTDFPGGWKEDSVNGFTGNGLNADQISTQSYVKKLLNWRKTQPVIATGKTLHFAPFDGVYVYFRYNNQSTIMVVMNKNKSAISLDNQRFAEILQQKKWATNVLSGEKSSLQQPLFISANQAVVLEIK